MKVLKQIDYLKIILIIFSLAIFSLWYFDSNLCKRIAPGFSSMGGSAVRDLKKISAGYTLFTTLGIPEGKSIGSERVFLIDIYGKEVHSWKTQYQPFSAQIKKNSNLVVSLMPPSEGDGPWITKPLIQELDWNGNVVWEYRNSLMHHDFEIVPNGNLTTIIYDKIPDDMAPKVKGGIDTPNVTEVFADSIIEVNKGGEIIWRWDLYKYLDPEKDIVGDFDLRSDWTHSNSVRYLEKDPIKGEPAYLLSVKNLSFVAIISRKTGEIIWRSPKGMLDHQHDASLLDSGNILVFDNGFGEHAKRDALLESSVKEIDPRTDKVVWQFKGSDPLEQSHFYNSTLGGAQKLKNGNVLITLGIFGQLIEVTSDKKIVWDYINPYNIVPGGKFPKNYIYKARRIYRGDISWPVELQEPDPSLSALCRERGESLLFPKLFK